MFNQIILGDCYELMKEIPDGSIDAIISDFPYNTTQAEWDQDLIDLPLLWKQLKRVIKTKGTVISTASQPFTTDLIMSNREWFKYELIWSKSHATGHLDANRRPMKQHENIIVFCEGQSTFNPQLTKKSKDKIRNSKTLRVNSDVYGSFKNDTPRSVPVDIGYPLSIVEFNSPYKGGEAGEHPTQKPVALFEYLIRTYTNPGEIVLDPFAGSGTTALAAYATGRQFICFEKERKYWEVANKRLAIAQSQLRFDEMVG
jgi:site-specific DNA-methyltransferase (adenine-specific)